MAPLAACRALEVVATYLGERPNVKHSVLVDISKSFSVIYSRNADSSMEVASVRAISDELDTSQATLQRWLPDETGSANNPVYLKRQTAKTAGNDNDLLNEFAITQQALVHILRERRKSLAGMVPTLSPLDILAIRGEIMSHPDKQAFGLLAVLNTLQPFGAIRFESDWAELWPQLGAAACLCPQVAQVLDNETALYTGILLAPVGSLADKPALHLDIVRANGINERVVVPGGIIKRLTFPGGESVRIRVRCEQGWTIDGHQRSLQLAMRGESLGLIIDTRGRPLASKPGSAVWRARIARDLQALTAH
jgi:hypothetical protein